jgi:hypothetical protein
LTETVGAVIDAMTPSSERAKSPKKADTTPDVSVADDLKAIDTFVLDQLTAIRKEQTRLKDYLAKADKLHDNVKESVWHRVVADYDSRAQALAAEATPLEDQVRVEYGKLKALLDRIGRVHEEAGLAKDELEFRHEVGELTSAQLKKSLEEPEATITQCQTDLAAVEEQQKRFLEAFESEDDLLAASPPTLVGKAAPAEAPADEASPDATRMVGPDETAPAKAGDDESGERTFLLPPAVLFIRFGDEETPTEYRLLAVNYLGRSEDNQVQIARPGVSRHHALVCAAADGFTIKDLDSQNGTYVNGDGVTERRLADGDTIVVGDTELVFRSPWPAETDD